MRASADQRTLAAQRGIAVKPWTMPVPRRRRGACRTERSSSPRSPVAPTPATRATSSRRACIARNANRLGLTRKPWVKSSLAPGSKTVELYLQAGGSAWRNWRSSASASSASPARLATACRGALDPKIQQEIIARDALRDRGTVGKPQLRWPHPPVRKAGLPGLAAAGGGLCDRRHDPLRHRDGTRSGWTANGKRDHACRTCGRSDAEIDAHRRRQVGASRSMYPPSLHRRCSSSPRGRAAERVRPPVRLAAPTPPTSAAPPTGTSEGHGRPRRPARAPSKACGRWRYCRDNITTDHLSPSNAIMADSGRRRVPCAHGPAGRGLQFLCHPPWRPPDGPCARHSPTPRLKNEMVRHVEGKRAGPDRWHASSPRAV